MLYRISVSNHQSIRDDVTLDFRVPGTTPDRVWLRQPTSQPALRVPAVITFIGPNGSGKTALLRTLADTIRFAAYSYGNRPGSIALFPSFAANDAMTKPTRIEIEFDAPWWDAGPDEPNRLFRYTLELHRGTPNLFPDTVGYEALRDFPRGRPRRFMERHPHHPVHVARDLSIKPNDDRLTSIPANASALSTLARLGVEKFSAIVDSLALVQMNVSAIDPVRRDAESMIHYVRVHPQGRERISDRLGRFDLGIEDMEVEQRADDKWRLVFSHSGLSKKLPVAFESDGTRHVLQAFPLLNSALETGSLAVMDSLDSHLHADLVDEILGWFRRQDTNSANAQLICSLHSLSALDDLEKEEVFIVEKDRAGATRAYGAREVQGVRRSSDLRKLYRSGSLGGLPSFG